MSYWKNYWNKVAQNSSPLAQVQRDAISKNQLLKIHKQQLAYIQLLTQKHTTGAVSDGCTPARTRLGLPKWGPKPPMV